MNDMLRARTALMAYYPILVISLCASFLFYKYILQVYPSVITTELMQEFNLTGASLGNLAATFYYAFVIAQLLVGILLDKYSVRWFTSAAIYFSAIGMLLFSQTHSLVIAEFSRALMGVGVAFATVAYMKLAAVWFSPKHYAFVGGLLATAAMAGAVFGEAPLSHFIDELGWRHCLYIVGIIGVFLGTLFFIIVRDTASLHEEQAKKAIDWADILLVLKNKQNWLLTFYSGLAFSPLAIFGGLWGNPFMQQAYHLNHTEAASMVSLVFIGLGIGSPILGIISDQLNNRRGVMLVSTLVSCITLVAVLYMNDMPIWLASCLLFLFGFGLGAFMLAFSIGKEINPAALTATVIAMINASDAFLDSITEPGIGKILDLFWTGKIVNGVHYFSLTSYHYAMALLPIYLLIACCLLLGLKDARNRL